MADKLSVLVIDSDRSTKQTLTKHLAQMINVELVGDLTGIDQAPEVIKKAKPDILILELPADHGKTLRWTERMKLEFPGMIICVSSQIKTTELILSAMRAGAQEFLARPIDPGELRKAVEKVTTERDQLLRRGTPEGGRIISLFSKKGGLGVTTLAVNLGVALSQAEKSKAAIVDLDLQLGDVSSFLNLSPEYSIVDAFDERDRVDPVKLQSCMTRHQSGVFVLSEPKNPADSENVTSSQLGQILQHLKSMFSYVIVDTPHLFDSRNLEAFELSDYIMLVLVPNISSVRATKKALSVFKDLGYAKDKVRLIVNRASKGDSIKVEEIEKTLRYPVAWVIPNNYRSVVEAINSGIPLVNHRGNSNVAKSISGLSADILEWNRSFYVEATG